MSEQLVSVVDQLHLVLFTVGAWGDGDGREAAAFVVVVYGWVIVVAVLGAAGCSASGWVF